MMMFLRTVPRTLAKRAVTRSYLGGASEGVHKLSESEEELFKIAQPKSEAILKEHTKLVDLETIPRTSLGDHTVNDSLDIRRKRLIYRSKQRGWLEVDVLLGTWAYENVNKLTVPELDEFEDFVNAETIDIYNIITLRVAIPDKYKTTHKIVERIQAWARNHPLGKADPQQYKKIKTDAKLI